MGPLHFKLSAADHQFIVNALWAAALPVFASRHIKGCPEDINHVVTPMIWRNNLKRQPFPRLSPDCDFIISGKLSNRRDTFIQMATRDIDCLGYAFPPFSRNPICHSFRQRLVAPLRAVDDHINRSRHFRYRRHFLVVDT